jgi:hypothetical protein
MKLTLLAALLVLPAFRASAQSAAGAPYLREYAFVAPTRDTASSGTQTVYAVGAGVEQLLGNRFGVGLDLNALIPTHTKASNTLGVASFNGYFHPIVNGKWDPFATGGYSLIFRNFTANGFNVGGGINYWFRENRGILFEVREEAGKHTPVFVENHYLEIRIGLTFR